MISRNAIDKLYETVGSDPESLVELIDCFLEEGPSIVGQIAASAVSGEHDVLRRSAHSLKSSARDFGATNLADLCAGLENDLRQGLVPVDAAVRSALVTAEWQRVEAALREIASEWGTVP